MVATPLNALLQRIRWFASGEGAQPVPAFDWISGRVGSRQNPDGMRSLIHASLALATMAALLDLACLARNAWASWALLSFLHLAWIGGFMVATVLNVGFLESLSGAPLRSLGGPNTLTLARGLCIPLLVYLVARRDFGLACGAYALATATDVIDGWWARHGGGSSKLGIVLDPIVDLLLHLAVFGALVWVGLLGATALVMILVRSGLLVFGTIALYLWKGCVRIQPTPWGKGTGLLLTLSTLALMALAAWAPGAGAPQALLRTILTVLLTLSVLHVLAIGAINVGRPAMPRATRTRAGSVEPAPPEAPDKEQGA
jgi:phosphatidylglycerophosphate synthase